jgi:hypothetical protein
MYPIILNKNTVEKELTIEFACFSFVVSNNIEHSINTITPIILDIICGISIVIDIKNPHDNN